MKNKEILKGQIYKTKVLSRFSSTPKTLHPIKILANIEGFVIFKQGPLKQAVEIRSFVQTYIQACKYKLVTNDFEYKGFLVVWDEGVYNIGGTCCALTKAEAKSKINEMSPIKSRTK